MDKEYSAKNVGAVGLRFFLVFLIFTVGFFGVFDYVKSNTDIFKVEMDIEKNESLRPNEKIQIVFSNYVMSEKVETALEISPKAEFKAVWTEKNRILEIYPKEAWKNGVEYSVSVKGGKNFIGLPFDSQTSFSVENIPRVASIFPAEGEKNILVDIEDPIVINFDSSVENYNVRIVFNPMGKLSYEANEGKNSIKIMPLESLEVGKRYDIYVDIKHKNVFSDENFERVFSSYFETKQLEVKEWSKDVAVRLFQAKNYTQSKFSEGKYIDINLKSQVMVIFEDGKAIDSYLISSGKAGMNTPEGSFQIYNKFPKPWSKKYSLFMPFWMAITSSGEFGIHELPEWPGGYKEGANHLGIPVSHGCVRLGVGPAERVYNWAEIGIPVITHY